MRLFGCQYRIAYFTIFLLTRPAARWYAWYAMIICAFCKRSWWLAVLLIGAAVQPAEARVAGWAPSGAGIAEARLSLITASSRHPKLLLAASPRRLYRSDDGGQSWRTAYQAAGKTELTAVAIDPADAGRWFLGTTEGLLISGDGGRRWQTVTSLPPRSGTCRALLAHPQQPGVLVLGSETGLFVSNDSGLSWRRALLPYAQLAIRDLAVDPTQPDRLYVLFDDALFATSLMQGRWEMLLRELRSTGDELPLDEPSEEPSEDTERASGLTSLAIDPLDPQRLFVAGRSGVRETADAGRTWRLLPGTGLGSNSIASVVAIAHSPTVVYAATTDGVARYHTAQRRWESLSQGLATHTVHRLASDGDALWAATDHGIYRFEPTEERPAAALADAPSTPDPSALLQNFSHEPSIGQIREAAIRYAEVEPGKIRRWRRQAALQALLPTFNLGFDRSLDTYVTSMGSTTNPAFDRILTTDDPSSGLDFSLNWHLGELIWNPDQTSIDSRSKLLVELRDDIINDATRIFFERRRLQIALLTRTPDSDDARIEQELRLQELTALLDGLTGGWFSQHAQPDMDHHGS